MAAQSGLDRSDITLVSGCNIWFGMAVPGRDHAYFGLKSGG
ncbi:hypothetical protein BRAO285_710017 [Bradyrhizobium sp. ORS 285]|nr:hypothetical protein BRAO285_710017 [Bradyrhizobium sp. ORS 285]